MFNVSVSTKVCSNHFVQGYRTSECPTDQLTIKRVNLKDLLHGSDIQRTSI